MSFHFMLLLFLIIIPSLILIWILRLVNLYRRGKPKRKSFYIQTGTLATILIIISWNLGIFPLSKNFYIKTQAEKLTGKSFWSWKDYSFDELGFRGEGYSIDIYKFSDEIAEYFKNPNQEFFESYPVNPDYRDHWNQVKWKPTPIKEDEQKYLNHATPNYGSWSKEKIEKMQYIRDLVNKKGSFYSYNERNGDVDFYIVAPNEKLIVMINHNL